MKVILLTVLLCLSASMSHAEVADSIGRQEKRSSTEWIKQLIANGFHINDSTVNYPRFPKFCLKVYNWGDRTFNSYDTTYVVSTGRNWKVQGKSFNWLENYAFLFPKHNEVFLRSNIYADIGGYLSFMAVSVGYMFNANELVNDRNDTRSMFNFNFTCALFNIDYTKTYTKGGAIIRKLGNYDDGKMLHIPFESVNNSTESLQATYFFGHRRYSHAAAYCYSKYQLKSAGSWMAGLYYLRQNVSLDFNGLPADMAEAIPMDKRLFKFHYTDYTLTAGYGYNWAISPRKWLLNVTFQQGVGYKHTQEDNTDSRRSMIAINPMVSGSVVYNHRALFVALLGRFNGRFYFNGNYTFFNSLSTAQLTVGARF